MWSGAPHGQKPFPTRASLTLCIKQSLRPRPCPEQFRKSDALSMEEAAHSVSKLLDAPRVRSCAWVETVQHAPLLATMLLLQPTSTPT